jgi:nucleotide-binding universal stress UspA family protein
LSGVDRVIIGASGSPGSLVALRYAEALARAHQATLVPVLAWEPPGGDRADLIQPSGHLRAVWKDLACQHLQNALVALWAGIPDDPLVQPQIERGPAGWVLVSVASRPGDVLVLGAGRRGALPRIARCQVSRYCVAHARCPVILVPPPELAREIGRSPLARQFWRKTLTPERIIGSSNLAGTLLPGGDLG